MVTSKCLNGREDLVANHADTIGLRSIFFETERTQKRRFRQRFEINVFVTKRTLGWTLRHLVAQTEPQM
jgi:hypothetical protein